MPQALAGPNQAELAHAGQPHRILDVRLALTARIGYKKAIVATAHKMPRIIHALLRKDKPYEDPNIDYEKLFVKRNAARWLRMLKKHKLLRELQAKTSSPDQ